MELVESGKMEFTCNAISLVTSKRSSTITKMRIDYTYVFSPSGRKYPTGDYIIPTRFNYYHLTKKLKQIRLNALAAYLAQSLAFGTYKNL